jgi:hypothetical protein
MLMPGLRGGAHQIVIDLLGFDRLRRAVLVAPSLALAAHCAVPPPAGAPPHVAMTCRPGVRWWQAGAWQDVCAAGGGTAALPGPRRRYELTLACAFGRPGALWRLPVARTVVLR